MRKNHAAAIRIDGGFMAVSKKVLGYQPTSDTKLSEYSDVIANHVEFRESAGVGERIKGEGNTFKPAVGRPRDWDFITKPARAAAVPDRAALTSRLR